MRNTFATGISCAISLGVAIAITACAQSSPDPNNVGGAQYQSLEQQETTSAADSAAGRATHQLKTAFVIVMENHNWDDIAGSSSAPYINKVLLPSSASTTNYFATHSAIHPSEPNYVWIESGSNLGIEDDHDPSENYRNTKKHLTTLLQTADVPWKTYQQGIDGKSCPLVSVGGYAPKHNAPIFFSDVTDNNNPNSPNCIAHVRPVEELEADLANGSVSGYVFITPDHCHNMHDACASGDNIKNGDDFLAEEIPKLQASDAYKNGGAIFVTWDESESGEHPVGMIVNSPLAKAGYQSSTAFTHSSLLRTMQDVFSVQPYLRDAANAQPLGELFTAFP